MRSLPAVLLTMALSWSAFGQPANIPGPSAALGHLYGVAVDPKGNVFIALDDLHMVVRLDAATGILTLVAGNGSAGFSGDDGPASSAQLNKPYGVAVDAAGSVYIADSYNGRIRKVSNGVITTVAGGGSLLGDNGPATSGQLSYPNRVALDSGGNLYIADYYRVRKVSSGVITTLAGTGTRGFSGDNGPATSALLGYAFGVALDAAGNVYIADYYNHRIRKVSNGVITTVAGNGTAGFSGDNGPALSAGLNYPSGVAVDSAGNLFIADAGNTRLRKVSDGVITTVAGNGLCCFAGDSGPAANGQFDGPNDVAVDSAGNLYMADNQRVRKVSSGMLYTVAGNGEPPPPTSGTYTVSTLAGGGLPVNIPGTSASLGADAPQCLAADRRGNVFFVVQHTVIRLDATTGVLTQAAGNGTTGFSGDNGPATSAQLNYPAGLAVDAAGNLYIADMGNNRVREVSNGVITTVAGSGTIGFAGDNGPATSAELSLYSNFACGLAVGSGGSLYLADINNARVRKVSDGVITTVAGKGTFGFSGDNGPATSAELGLVFGLAVDSAGSLYMADRHRIRRVSNGVITTVAGNGTAGSNGDGGPATSAQLYNPHGIAVDLADNLYIANSFANIINKVSNGVISKVAGGGSAGGDNGEAASASLYRPYSVAVDAAGNLYIADSGNNRIRKVSNGVIATVAGGGTQVGDNSSAIGAQLASPAGLTIDSGGNLYVADTGNDRIRKITNGVITTVAGSGTLGFWTDTSPATITQLYHPYGVTLGPAGDLYIADDSPAAAPLYISTRIRKVSHGVITPVADLLVHTAVALDAAGNIYFIDLTNYRIRKISNGVTTTVVGPGSGFPGGGENPAAIAQLDFPSGITLDSAGNLYIADTNHNRILKVSGKVVTIIAGTGVQGSNGDGGAATSAKLCLPSDLALDAAGALYFSEACSALFSSAHIRKVSNEIITTIGSGYARGLAVDATGKVYFTEGNTVKVLTPVPCSYSVAPASLPAPASGGNLTVSIQTTPSCPWTVAGLPGWMSGTGTASGAGSATVALAVAVNPGPDRTATISIAGISVQVTQQNSFSINAGGVVNAASSAAGSAVAPGSIATAYGSFPINSLATASSSPLPSNLAGLSMQFGGALKVPLFAVSAGQVNFQVPWELAGQSQTSLSATVNGQSSGGQTIKLAASAPGIFSINAQGAGQGAVLDLSYRLVDSSNPASAGKSIVQIYCTGLGAVTNQPPSGSPAPSSTLSRTTTPPTVTIGGAQASVLFAGLAPGTVGEYQVNALVPAGSSKGAAVPVVIGIGGVTSNTVTIAVQ